MTFASDRKVADPWFDPQTGDASLCTYEKHVMLIFDWDQAVCNRCGGAARQKTW